MYLIGGEDGFSE